MWERREIKARGKQAFRANYWHCVIVSLIMVALFGAHGPGRLQELRGSLHLDGSEASAVNAAISAVEGVTGELPGLLGRLNQATHAQKGIFATMFKDIAQSDSLLLGFLQGVNQLFLGSRVSHALLLALALVVAALLWLFVRNALEVGRCRFFLENRLYAGSRTERLLFMYRIRRVGSAAQILFLRALYTLLWSLTIVGGIVKSYSYRMVPMLVAENPDISAKEAFRLSRLMMNGQKWRVFVLDLSFLGWRLLSLASFGLFDMFFLYGYTSATDAELYIALRERAMASGEAAFTDRWLAEKPQPALEEYPAGRFTVPEHGAAHRLHLDAGRRYSPSDLIILFFGMSFVGYVYEVIYYLFALGEFVNRGTMYGPWLPVYGVGGLLTLLALRGFTKRPLVVFVSAFVLCGLLEYATAWYLETFAHTKWWDYTGFFLNIQGRVCLEGLLIFATGCCFSIYLFSPMVAGLFDRLPRMARIALCAVLIALFLLDAAISARHPNMAAGVAIGQ